MRLRQFLDALPESYQLLLGVCRQGLVRRRFHPAEAPVKFVAGPMQGLLRVHAGHLADLGGDEEQVSQLLLYAVRRV